MDHLRQKKKWKRRARKSMGVRRRLRIRQVRPRLSVHRSGRHISAQVIDDLKGVTLAAASTLEKDFDGSGSKADQAVKVGTVLAERAKAAGVEAVLFDRGWYLYHGRVKALAEAAREGGLNF